MEVWYRLVLGSFAAWRVTHLFNVEDGPWRLLVRLRSRWPKLFDCFYCLSVWVAIPFAYLLGERWMERGLLVPVLSAAAIIVERSTQQPMPDYFEDRITGPGGSADSEAP